jgi:hypothetical protein
MPPCRWWECGILSSPQRRYHFPTCICSLMAIESHAHLHPSLGLVFFCFCLHIWPVVALESHVTAPLIGFRFSMMSEFVQWVNTQVWAELRKTSAQTLEIPRQASIQQQSAKERCKCIATNHGGWSVWRKADDSSNVDGHFCLCARSSSRTVG